nr:transposase [Eisenibacter elegans]
MVYLVLRGLAKKGKSSTGWFYGFKLHVLINQWGNCVCFPEASYTFGQYK